MDVKGIPVGVELGRLSLILIPPHHGLACPLGYHPQDGTCPLPDNFHGARVIVLFIHPHDKHRCIW